MPIGCGVCDRRSVIGSGRRPALKPPWTGNRTPDLTARRCENQPEVKEATLLVVGANEIKVLGLDPERSQFWLRSARAIRRDQLQPRTMGSVDDGVSNGFTGCIGILWETIRNLLSRLQERGETVAGLDRIDDGHGGDYVEFRQRSLLFLVFGFWTGSLHGSDEGLV